MTGLNPEQQRAAEMCLDWLQSARRGRAPLSFHIGGKAGVGKTHLAKRIVQAAKPRRPRHLALMGSAARNLGRRGCDPFDTIHHTIYTPDVRTGRLTFNLRSEIDADLLVVDEGSVIDDPLWNDVASFRIPTIVLSDRGQLPPLTGPGPFQRQDADAELTKIERQAADNPIIRAAWEVRQDRRADLRKYADGEHLIVTDRLDKSAMFHADVVIAGKHRTRIRTNETLRLMHGHVDPIPLLAGARFSPRRNRGRLYTNAQYELTRPARRRTAAELIAYFSREYEAGNRDAMDAIRLLRYDETAAWLALPVMCKEVGTEKEILALLYTGQFEAETRGDHQFEVPQRHQKVINALGLVPATWGYCLTGHAVQGSQYGNAFILDDGWGLYEDPTPYGDPRAAWRYTTLTRACHSAHITRLSS